MWGLLRFRILLTRDYSYNAVIFSTPLWMQRHEVDLALWGHHHSYQTTCPVYQEKCTEGATTHIVIGMGGQSRSTNVQ